LEGIEGYDYVFLSPVFDSISKEGYRAAFSHEELLRASEAGLINAKVIALGGIDATTLPLLKPYKFGGIGVLGAIWDAVASVSSVEEGSKRVVQRFLDLTQDYFKRTQMTQKTQIFATPQKINFIYV
jgi:thiamine monophosphate synthase